MAVNYKRVSTLEIQTLHLTAPINIAHIKYNLKRGIYTSSSTDTVTSIIGMYSIDPLPPHTELLAIWMDTKIDASHQVCPSIIYSRQTGHDSFPARPRVHGHPTRSQHRVYILPRRKPAARKRALSNANPEKCIGKRKRPGTEGRMHAWSQRIKRGGCDNIPARARIIHPMWAAEDGSIARDCSREWVKLQQPTNDIYGRMSIGLPPLVLYEGLDRYLGREYDWM